MARDRLLSSRLITTFGLGHCRPASGTWGSMPPAIWAGLLMVLAGVAPLGGGVWWVWHVSLWLTLLVFSWAVIVGADRAEALFGADPKEVVADETAGQCIPLLAIPHSMVNAGLGHALLAVALAFVLFRLLDIFKPWPAGRLQNVPGGWGILLDDLVAGVYAAIGLWLISLAY